MADDAVDSVDVEEGADETGVDLRGPRNVAIATEEINRVFNNRPLGVALCTIGVAFAAFGFAERIGGNDAVDLPVFVAILAFSALLIILGTASSFFTTGSSTRRSL